MDEDDYSVAWALSYSRRAYFPERLEYDDTVQGDSELVGEAVRNLAIEKSRANGATYTFDAMTDQFNVYRVTATRRELIAVYMAA